MRMMIGAAYDPFSTFGYTGKLRPVYPLSPKRAVPEHIQRPDYSETGIPKSEFSAAKSEIKVLTPEEIEGVRVASRVTL